MFAAASGRLGQDRQHRVVVEALRDINFSLRGGDRLGLIGSNGAGKTTLLRTLAGIYEPVIGRVRVQGSVNALLDSSLGMNMELTGRENIMLRGLYNGLPRACSATAGGRRGRLRRTGRLHRPAGPHLLGSGMVVRLGFALATAIRPQILLMDEWILAGDAEFIDRAQLRLEAMVRGADILVLSTHDMRIVREWCSRVVWLDQGNLRLDGPPDSVADAYLGRTGQPAVAALAD